MVARLIGGLVTYLRSIWSWSGRAFYQALCHNIRPALTSLVVGGGSSKIANPMGPIIAEVDCVNPSARVSIPDIASGFRAARSWCRVRRRISRRREGLREEAIRELRDLGVNINNPAIGQAGRLASAGRFVGGIRRRGLEGNFLFIAL